MRRKRILPVLAAVLALAACGTTEQAASPEPAAAAAERITLTDGRGEEVVLDGPAQRTVGLEWGLVEHLVSLGVQPVGVADVEGYGNWVQSAPLTGDVADVGVRGEPSVETIAALAPDLVLATTDLPEAAVAQLEAVAPVLVVRPADAADPIGQMRRTVELVARATGTEDAARTLLGGFDATLAEARDAVAAAGMAGRPLAFSDAYLDGGQVSIRPFTGTSLAGAVAAEIGLPSAWTLPGDPDYGLAATDVEGLTALGDVEYVYYDNAAVTPDPVSEALTGNAVWDSLPFVRAGNVSRLPDGIWMFGGPASMGDYAEAVVAAVTD